ncbi:MAG: MoxR family ATPase [Deltaproteobacteria bacterium]|nr:MoxR family ATPase [Deltaproteobacteria bacterium]
MSENSLSASAPSPETCSLLTEDAKTIAHILDEMGKIIVGQEDMNRALISGILTGGHILLEGLPGLAKTLAVKTLATVLDAKFQRVQFTPDLLPSDLIGTMVYHENSGEFTPKKGPIFANLVLADEINRAPAKVQSALLEAMAEKQVTIGDQTFPLTEPFLVLATQNPIEQEGTYHLPEAQLDRFMFKIKVSYPNRSEERVIIERMSTQPPPKTQNIFSTSGILEIRNRVEKIYVDERIKNYILRLVLSTRKREIINADEANLKSLDNIRSLIHIGASPRASLFLIRAAKVAALFEQRAFVTPDDVKSVAHAILRHRLILTFDAEARGLTTDDVVHQLLETVNVP